MRKNGIGLITAAALLVLLNTSCMSMLFQGAGFAGAALSGIGVQALPQGSSEAGDFWLTRGRDSGATIIRYIGKGKEARIPSELEGVALTAISGYQMALLGGDTRYTGAFQNTGLTSVTISDSITAIGMLAFSDNQLAAVTIGGNVASIETEAFARNRLTSVVIPDSVTAIGGNAFANNRLTSVTIGNKVTTIGGGAFSNNQLASVIIPDTVTSIGVEAFKGNQLTTITIPATVKGIGRGAFENNRFTRVVIPFTSVLQADFAWGGANWRTGIDEKVIVVTP